ncbi:PAS domain-containing protein [Mucilaginibacter sp. KACC 22773]|uniref:ATP-binding protein n=1 Tax=Mucilaginibacter sp. KACC 22773 TaxID=3025671 RepID=UPI0023655DCE|nr:ATP-binding protein [Mucilaginibacter sp. KACC 22773]WDF75904.1 PAS domain-containing protein [Mucilaginibacter sp. KACC 22773]
MSANIGPSAQTLKALETVPVSIAILSPQLLILTASDQYLRETETIRENIVGRYVFDVFPDNPDTPEAMGVFNLNASLQSVLLNKQPHKMAIQRYDVPHPMVAGQFITRYWEPLNTPVFDDAHHIQYIIHMVTNVTDKVLADEHLALSKEELISLNHKLNEANHEIQATVEELEASNEELSAIREQLQHTNILLEERVTRRTKQLFESELNLRTLIATARNPLAILRGRNWTVEIANQAIADIWGKVNGDITGKQLLKILPELEGQPFAALLARVYDTGVSYGEDEEIFYLDTPDGTVVKYISFYYDPLFDTDGNVTGVVVAANDITGLVEARQLLEKSYDEQKVLNEEIGASNEELAAANEELLATNEELIQAKANLSANIVELAEREAKLSYMLADAPVAIAVLKGRDFIVESANKKVLAVWGKTNNIIGKPLQEAIPEWIGRKYLNLLGNVYDSGKPYYGNEVKTLLEQDGKIEEVYSNFVYQPLKNPAGKTTSIMLLAHVVTEQVKARKAIELAEEKQRIAVEAADMGTWYINATTRELVTNGRLRQLFGFNADEEMPYDAAALQIPEPYRERVLGSIEHSIATGALHQIEHPIIGYHDKQTRWVKATGKLYEAEPGKPPHFSGVMFDITDRREQEQRKDDFISIASHELKTPITSLKASLQLLELMKDNPSSQMLPKLIEQSSRSMNKISALVEDLLNVSRMNETKLQLNKAPFNIAQMLNVCCNHVRIAGKHELVVIGDEQLVVNADEHQVDQAVVNLVNNSVKYAPESKKIYFVIEKLDGFAKISVKDTGPGMSKDKIGHLFDRYYRAEPASYQNAGLGLGLYISSEIVKRHGGEIGVESELGHGSTFWFTLPLE